MKMLIVGAAFLAALATPVSAESKHDRKLEQAIMDIVAAKMGDIRGSFAYDREPEFVTGQDMIRTGSTGTFGLRAGQRLAIGSHRQPSRVSF